MTTSKKKWGRPIILGVAIVAAVLAAVFAFSGGGDSAQARTVTHQATAQEGNIAQTVTATGSLTTDGGLGIMIPAGLVVDQVFFQAGDFIHQGDVLASFTQGSIQTQLQILLESLAELDEEIEAERALTQSHTITAGVAGRVEEIFAQVGDYVVPTMLEHGALLTLLIDGSETPIGVLGTTGRISRVHVAEGATVRAGAALFTLEDLGHSATYQALLAQREDKAEVLVDLLAIAQNNMLFAPFDGIIESVHIGNAPSSGGGGGSSMPSIPGGLPPGMFMGLSHAAVEDTNPVVRLSYTQGISLLETTEAQMIVSLDSLNLVAPVAGATPQGALGGEGFVGLVQWMPEGDTFTPQTQYRAMLFLQPSTGYFFGQPVLEALAEGRFPLETATVLGYESIGLNLAIVLEFPPTEGEDGGTSGGPGGPNVPGFPPDFPGFPGFPEFPSGGMPNFNMPSFSMPSMPSFDGPNFDATPSAFQVQAFTIASGDVMHLSITVDERDILSLQVGQPAEILLDALPGVGFSGEISRINVAGQGVSGGARYTVELILPRTEQMLPGMSASAVITTSEAINILMLPVQAIQEAGGRVYVYTAQASDGTPTNPVDVVTGISDGLYVEILSGLNAGQAVYYAVRVATGFPHWGPGPGPGWGN